MEPIKSNITSTGKALSTITAKCVIWDGPDITCLDGTTLCKGQTIEVSLYTLANKLCAVYEAINLTDLDTCINNILSGTTITVTGQSSIKEVFSAIINKVCAQESRIIALEGAEPTILTAVVPECLRVQAATYGSWQGNPFFTLDLVDYAELVAAEICTMLFDITNLQNNVITINRNIDDLWRVLNTCSNATSNLVMPTCTNNWTLNPTNDPQSIQVAYGWLESDFCNLRAALGTPEAITTNIAKQCPDLGSSDRLSSGGVMDTLSGWVDNPINLADSVGNLWLTVCDIRAAVATILDTCCFSPCSYLEFGYDLIFDPLGAFVDIVFNTSGNAPTIYTSSSAAPPLNSPYSAVAGATFTGPLAWIATQFPIAGQTNMIITLDDGNGNTILLNAAKISQLAVLSSPSTNNGIRVLFATYPSYDKNSLNQTINFNFDYEVFDPVTGEPPVTCTVDQTDGFVYECDTAPVYPGNVVISTTVGTDLRVIIRGVYTETLSQEIGTATGGTNTPTVTIVDSSKTWASNQFINPTVTDATGYIIYVTEIANPTNIQSRRITGNTGNTITVDVAWDTVPTVGAFTYEIKDKFYAYPFNALFYPAYIQNILSFNFQIVPTASSGYDPNNPSGWVASAQASNVDPVVACGAGWNYASFGLSGNTEYAISMQVNYPCNSSAWTIINKLLEVPVSVASVIADPSALVSASVNVEDRLSNNVVPNYITFGGNPKVVTAGTTFIWPVELPVLPNLTQFELAPKVANWRVSGAVPQLCLCGMKVDPDAIVNNAPIRNTILGNFRGYDVSVALFNPASSSFTPVLDSLGAPYLTNSIVDSSILFTGNTPGSPILLSLLNTFPNTSYPIQVTYDPAPYPVDISPDFHTITQNGFNIVINNTTGLSIPASYRIDITLAAWYWDTGTNVYVLYPGAPNTSQISITGGSPIPVGITTRTVNPQVVSAKYGDKITLHIAVFEITGYTNVASGTVTTVPRPLPATVANGPFDCRTQSWVVGTGIAAPNNWYTVTSNPIGTYQAVLYKGIVTEDYTISPSSPSTITLLIS